MNVSDAVASRYSCRAFLPTPVPEKTVRTIIEQAVAVCPAACASCPGGHSHAHNENELPHLSELAVLDAAE